MKAKNKKFVPTVRFTWFGTKWAAKVQELPQSENSWWAGTTVFKDCAIIIDAHCVGDAPKMVRYLRHELAHVAERYSGFTNGTTPRRITEEDVAVFAEAWGGEIAGLAEEIASHMNALIKKNKEAK